MAVDIREKEMFFILEKALPGTSYEVKCQVARRATVCIGSERQEKHLTVRAVPTASVSP